MTEEAFFQFFSPHVFFAAYGISKTGSVLQEPILARYEKKSFDLRNRLDSYTNRILSADQILARAVDNLILKE